MWSRWAVVVGAMMLGGSARAGGPLAELPLDFEKELPLARIHVDGKPLTMVLDTAAAGCVIDRDKAARLGIKATESAFSSGSGGTLEVGLARGLRLDAAGVAIAPDFVVLTPLAGIPLKKQDGVLGTPLFGKWVVEIDYAARVARIFDPRSYEPAAGGEVFKLWMTHGPTVRGRLNVAGAEEIAASLQLDTGSSHVLTLCKPFVERLGLLEKVPGLVAGETHGIGGSSPDKVGRIARVGIGGFMVEGPEVRFSTHDQGAFTTTAFDGNIGNGFLSRWIVTFDIPHSRLILRKAPAAASGAGAR